MPVKIEHPGNGGTQVHLRTLLAGIALGLAVAGALVGCIVPTEPPRAGSASRVASSALAASGYGVSAQSPLAQTLLIQVCKDAGGCSLMPVDSESGEVLANIAPLSSGNYPLHALSPDGRTLATVTYGSALGPSNGKLLLTDLESWSTITTTIPITQVYMQPLFSPDGSRLAMVQQVHSPSIAVSIRMIEVAVDRSASGEAASMRATDRGSSAILPLTPLVIAFSRDGVALNLYGNTAERIGMAYDPVTQVARMDAESLAIEWQQALPEVLDGQYLGETEKEKGSSAFWDPHIGVWWQPARVFSHDGDTLYLVHANEDRMTTVDFADARVATVEMRASLGWSPADWVERLLALTARPAHAKILNGIQLEGVLSFHGDRLYVTGMEREYAFNEYTQEYLPLRVIAADDGRVLMTGPAGTIAEPTDVELRLFLGVYDYDPQHPTASEWTVVVEPGQGNTLAEVENWRIFPARRLDGAALLVGTHSSGRGQLALIDPDTYAPTLVQFDNSRSWASWLLP